MTVLMEHSIPIDEILVRRVALEEGCDARTVRKALRGGAIRGYFTSARVARAIARLHAMGQPTKADTTP